MNNWELLKSQRSQSFQEENPQLNNLTEQPTLFSAQKLNFSRGWRPSPTLLQLKAIHKEIKEVNSNLRVLIQSKQSKRGKQSTPRLKRNKENYQQNSTKRRESVLEQRLQSKMKELQSMRKDFAQLYNEVKKRR